MIEHIDLNHCTGCGICDLVCPADVIHMTETIVPSDVPGLGGTQIIACHQISGALHYLLQLRNVFVQKRS
jgi:ferredoxin